MIASNALRASVNQYECSIATPRSNCVCTLASQDVGNVTFPSLSCWARPGRGSATAHRRARSTSLVLIRPSLAVVFPLTFVFSRISDITPGPARPQTYRRRHGLSTTDDRRQVRSARCATSCFIAAASSRARRSSGAKSETCRWAGFVGLLFLQMWTCASTMSMACPLDLEDLGARAGLELARVDRHGQHAVVPDSPGQLNQSVIAEPLLQHLHGRVVDPMSSEELLRERH